MLVQLRGSRPMGPARVACSETRFARRPPVVVDEEPDRRPRAQEKPRARVVPSPWRLEPTHAVVATLLPPRRKPPRRTFIGACRVSVGARLPCRHRPADPGPRCPTPPTTGDAGSDYGRSRLADHAWTAWQRDRNSTGRTGRGLHVLRGELLAGRDGFFGGANLGASGGQQLASRSRSMRGSLRARCTMELIEHQDDNFQVTIERA